MDNLTHSLFGAILGQAGLKAKTGFAMPTLIIAANLPDIDAVAVLLGGQQHLALRRGMTHGPIAILILPLILWAIMIWFDHWQGRSGKRPEKRQPIHRGWLLVLAYIGCLTHPALDWLNSYGIRLLAPFSQKWYYGDSIFIVDPWIWAALIAGIWVSLRRERSGQLSWRRPALVSILMVLAYINANITISNAAVNATARSLHSRVGVGDVEQIIANPVPLFFWRREMLFGAPNNYYRAEYSLFSSQDILQKFSEIEIARHAPHLVDVAKLRARDADLDAFLFWSRMPYDALIIENGKRQARFHDARFSSPQVSDRFGVTLNLRGDEEMVGVQQ